MGNMSGVRSGSASAMMKPKRCMKPSNMLSAVTLSRKVCSTVVPSTTKAGSAISTASFLVRRPMGLTPMRSRPSSMRGQSTISAHLPGFTAGTGVTPLSFIARRAGPSWTVGSRCALPWAASERWSMGWAKPSITWLWHSAHRARESSNAPLRDIAITLGGRPRPGAAGKFWSNAKMWTWGLPGLSV
ncbi:hypothetical protein A6A05_18300 [Magnetospirillum moscoviense]|uniref:Uncharacterized protein n=1 Tax=Magnetospirillum moscoviense TaxID=1437059 RepID=A0A178N0B2_9PROT|nr:hypothetical protein A6A05_18300 [Magnetospirillum moscoviense]